MFYLYSIWYQWSTIIVARSSLFSSFSVNSFFLTYFLVNFKCTCVIVVVGGSRRRRIVAVVRVVWIAAMILHLDVISHLVVVAVGRNVHQCRSRRRQAVVVECMLMMMLMYVMLITTSADVVVVVVIVANWWWQHVAHWDDGSIVWLLNFDGYRSAVAARCYCVVLQRRWWSIGSRILVKVITVRRCSERSWTDCRCI